MEASADRIGHACDGDCRHRADKVKVGQPVKFSVLAQPGRVFEAQIKYVDASIDPTSRRRMVRAEIPNTDGLLTPEMFATVKIDIGEDVSTPAVPIGAVIYEGEAAHVWAVNADRGAHGLAW